MIEPVRVKAGKKMNTKQFLSDILDEFNKIYEESAQTAKELSNFQKKLK